ncbi:MAG: ISNCY family transposase [candidate division WOR-3 bacterium]
MDRLQVLTRTFDNLTAASAAKILDLSPRQVFRLKARLRQLGPEGIVHGNRGRTPINAKPKRLRRWVLSLYEKEFSDHTIAHFSDVLAEEYHLRVGYSTLWRWLHKANLVLSTYHTPSHRRHRERRARFGELLFLDGSPHPWFGLSRPSVTLILATDDATGKPLYGLFAPQETLNACFEVLYHICRKYGIPGALYLDRASHFTTTRHGGIHRFQRDDQLTHFEVALKTLAIEPIFAHSPQARGRGERINGSFQRRLVPELRRKGITDIATATNYLNQIFIPQYARRFGRPPKDPNPAFHHIPNGTDLRTILCVKETRTVANDDTISYKGITYQLLLTRQTPSLVGAKIEIQVWFDNSIHAFYPHLGEIPIRPLPKLTSNTPMTFSLNT